MRRLLLPLALLACFAAPSHATEGMNLRWDACRADGGVRNKTFACDTNSGSEQLFVSFEVDSALSGVVGIEAVVRVGTPAGPPSMSWWQFKNVGTCRQTALTASFAPGYASPGCQDYWLGAAAGGISTYGPYTVDNYRLIALAALPQAGAFNLPAHQETFAMRLLINHSKTVGAGACPGCADPVCIGLENVGITYGGSRSLRLYTETTPGSSTAGWQGGNASSYEYWRLNLNYWLRLLDCAAAVPAQNRTWGSIKSLYH